MALEVEAKFRIDSFGPLRNTLREQQALYLGQVLETNRIYDNAADQLRRSGCGLRLRTTRLLDGSVEKSTLTFKGPMQPGSLKIREETEITVEPPEVTAQLLAGLGYQPFLIFEKFRESWQLKKCRIELDELPMLGRYVEIEGPHAEVIEATALRFHFQPAARIAHTYVHMLQSMLQALPQANSEVRFAADWSPP
ncbi:MAG: hypothetical protein HJJLKODD_02149 [Phycisphaerae bacterium]|nr:hypothetical protein [Phycisphaerae bacterium]